MKVTLYFLETRQRADRRNILFEWITIVIDGPLRVETQSDGRVKLWARIPEAGGKYLRVILLEDKETIHNAFFDSTFREES